MKYLLIFALLLPTSAIATGKKPEPRPAPEPETRTVFVEDSDKSKHLFIGFVVGATIVCLATKCWEEKKDIKIQVRPGDDR